MLHHNTFVVCKQKTSNLYTYLFIFAFGWLRHRSSNNDNRATRQTIRLRAGWRCTQALIDLLSCQQCTAGMRANRTIMPQRVTFAAPFTLIDYQPKRPQCRSLSLRPQSIDCQYFRFTQHTPAHYTPMRSKVSGHNSQTKPPRLQLATPPFSVMVGYNSQTPNL